MRGLLVKGPAGLQALETMPGSAQHLEATLGQLRCLNALAEWEQLFQLCKETWPKVEPHTRRDMATFASNAAWHMGQWDDMSTYVEGFDGLGENTSSTGAFLRAVLCVRRGDHGHAKVSASRRAGKKHPVRQANTSEVPGVSLPLLDSAVLIPLLRRSTSRPPGTCLGRSCLRWLARVMKEHTGTW